MLILGIDPGIAIVGYGLIRYENNRFTPIDYGAIETKSTTPTVDRLIQVHEGLYEIVEKYHPDVAAIEELFFQHNQTTIINVAQARGALLMALARHRISIFEYTPMQVKQAVTGYGRAEKHQVMEMVKSLLQLKAVPKPDDTADALALAICHGHTAGSLYGKLTKG